MCLTFDVINKQGQPLLEQVLVCGGIEVWRAQQLAAVGVHLIALGQAGQCDQFIMDKRALAAKLPPLVPVGIGPAAHRLDQRDVLLRQSADPTRLFCVHRTRLSAGMRYPDHDAQDGFILLLSILTPRPNPVPDTPGQQLLRSL